MSEQINQVRHEAPGPMGWVCGARKFIEQSKRSVVVFISSHRGSTPREKDTWLLIGENETVGTLGGGEVERIVIASARDMLAGRKEWQRSVEDFRLGPDLGQCCGGTLSVVFEPLAPDAKAWLVEAAEISFGYVLLALGDPAAPPRIVSAAVLDNLSQTTAVHIQPLIDARPQVLLYGAGHVGCAIAAIAAQLPVRLDVIDERKNELSKVPLAGNVRAVHSDNPTEHVKNLDQVCAVLIMTHSHALDYRLCSTLLEGKEIQYLGLIGSASKGARFRHALSEEGFGEAQISRLICPIGSAGPEGKEAGVIAIAALSELMTALLQSARVQPDIQPKLKGQINV